MKLRMLVSWCLIAVVPASMWAQSSESSGTAQETRSLAEGHSNDVKKKIEQRGIEQKTKVTLRNKTEVKGYISRIDADSFQLTDKKSGRVTTIAYQDVERVRKPGMSAGAKIATIAGVAVGVFVAGILISLATSGE